MYRFVEKVKAETHDAFVAAHPLSNLLQSSSWAKVKENWGHEIFGVMEDDHLIASALVLIKRLPMHFTMMYIPRGPIMDYENARLVRFFFQELKKWAKKRNALFVKMDPGIHVNDYRIEEQNTNYYPVCDTILSNMKAAGCVHKGFTTYIEESIQARFQANVMLHEGFADEMTKKGKKMLAIANKKKVEVAKVGYDGVDAFAKIMKLTEERQQIHLRDQHYYETLLNAYGDDAQIFLGKLNLRQLYEETKSRFDKNVEDLKNCPENAKKKRFTLEELHASLTRELQELSENLERDGDVVVLSGCLVIKFGKTSELLYAGMDDRYKRYMAPYLTWLTGMHWGYECGCTMCNMGGVEGDLKDGLTLFKSSFNPMINEFIGEFDLPVNGLLYHASEMAYKIRKRKNAKK